MPSVGKNSTVSGTVCKNSTLSGTQSRIKVGMQSSDEIEMKVGVVVPKDTLVKSSEEGTEWNDYFIVSSHWEAEQQKDLLLKKRPAVFMESKD